MIKIKSAWDFCNKIPFIGSWTFSWLISIASPYTGTIPLRISTIKVGSCTSTMTDWFWIRNPFKSIHAAALVNMGEFTMGMAVLTWCESNNSRAIPSRLEANFIKKARGTLKASCTVSDCLDSEQEKSFYTAETLIYDQNNDLVAQIIGKWAVSRLKKKVD